MDAQRGTVFGRYRLLRPIASDAVTTTYFATVDGVPQRSRGSRAEHYAIRIAGYVDPNDRPAVDTTRQFLSEAQQAGVIDHPTVVRPLDLGMIEGRPYVATPFVRAVPLGEWLNHGGTVNPSAALAMFAQLAGALDAAHRAGIVHGALSPRTIWVGPGAGEGVAYIAYLTGFGTSTLLRRHLADAPPGPPVDDVLYVAPEQLRGELVTGRCDQYALAGAVFHTLVGRPPYERTSRSKLYGAHLLAPPPVPDGTGEQVAPATSAALRKALSKEPSERYPTCGALIHDALPAEQVARSPAAQHARPSAPGVAARLRTWWPLVLVALVAAGVALWLALRPGPDPQSDGTPTPLSARVPRSASEQPGAVATPAAHDITWRVPVTTSAVTRLAVLDDVVLAVDELGVTALEAGDGSLRWKLHAGAAVEVAANEDVLAHSGRVLTGIDRVTGEVRWTAAGMGRTRTLTATGRTLVAVARGGSGPQVVAIDGLTGAELWHLNAGSIGKDAMTVAAATPDLTYVVRGGWLGAADPATATVVRDGRKRVDEPSWRARADRAWPVVTPADGGAIVATRQGRVCHYAAGDGALGWCAQVPGVEAEQPRLLAAGATLIVVTSEAVVALDGASGETRWSVSPGSAANQVAIREAWVAIAGGDGVGVHDIDSGERVLALPQLTDVTALAFGDAALYAALGDGDVIQIDLRLRGDRNDRTAQRRR